MAGKAKTASPKDMTDHVFEFRKGGVVYESRHRIYTDQSTGKVQVYSGFIATSQEIKDRADGGYRPYLDGKPYKPE